MLRRCYLVVHPDGTEAVFLEPSKAFDYAVQKHGYVIRMYGNDDKDQPSEPDIPQVIVGENP